jgi:hypothetical protein
MIGLILLPPLDALQSVRTTTSSSIRIQLSQNTFSSRSSRSWVLFRSKDEEIAKLEEQLKKLKEDKASELLLETAPQNGEIIAPAEPEVPLEMFLSEGWKEKEVAETSSAAGGGGGVLTSILGVVALVVGLAIFSQIPIGQEDLSKYSAIKAPTEQIDLGDLNRARNGMGDL